MQGADRDKVAEPCPTCGGAVRVAESRTSTVAGAPARRRKRVCQGCGAVRYTVEIPRAVLESLLSDRADLRAIRALVIGQDRASQ